MYATLTCDNKEVVFQRWSFRLKAYSSVLTNNSLLKQEEPSWRKHHMVYISNYQNMTKCPSIFQCFLPMNYDCKTKHEIIQILALTSSSFGCTFKHVINLYRTLYNNNNCLERSCRYNAHIFTFPIRIEQANNQKHLQASILNDILYNLMQ